MIRTKDANDCLISNEEQILSCNDVDGKDDRSKREREANGTTPQRNFSFRTGGVYDTITKESEIETAAKLEGMDVHGDGDKIMSGWTEGNPDLMLNCATLPEVDISAVIDAPKGRGRGDGICSEQNVTGGISDVVPIDTPNKNRLFSEGKNPVPDLQGSDEGIVQYDFDGPAIEDDINEVNDGWHLEAKEFKAGRVEGMPKRHRCVCGVRWCAEITVGRFRVLGSVSPLRCVANNSYRITVWEHFGFEEMRLMGVNFRINLHHYAIEERHLAYRKGELQFRNGEVVVVPKYTEANIRLEIENAGAIKAMNDGFYDDEIHRHLVGKGDGSLTLTKLKNIRDEREAGHEDRTRLPIDAVKGSASFTTCLLDQSKSNDFQVGGNTIHESVTQAASLLDQAKCNGSQLVGEVIMTMKNELHIAVPDDIKEEEYLHYHLQRGEIIEPCPDGPGRTTVTARIPRSVASRRKVSRPAKKDISQDITLTVATDPERIMNTLLPMNEPPKRSKKRCYMDAGFVNPTNMNLRAESQGKVVDDCILLQCYDEKRQHHVYIDVDGSLPLLSGGQNSPWIHAHYFLVKELLNDGEILRALELCKQHNMTYLPVVLIFLCRMKGKMATEKNVDVDLQEIIYDWCANKTVMGKVGEFELFFERFLNAFLGRIHILDISHFTRMTWAHWNFWRCDREYLYTEADRRVREATRAIAGEVVDDKTRMSNMCLHYITTLLHTQGM